MRTLLLLIVCSYCLASDITITSKIDIDKLVSKLAKSFDLERSVKTIIKIESDDGKYLINLQDPSCGITHINIKTYMKRHNIRDTAFNRNKSCQDLINNHKLAIANAIEELLFWQEYHCDKNGCTNEQYQNMIKSYNAGWNFRSKKAKEYYSRFLKAYKELFKD